MNVSKIKRKLLIAGGGCLIAFIVATVNANNQPPAFSSKTTPAKGGPIPVGNGAPSTQVAINITKGPQMPALNRAAENSSANSSHSREDVETDPQQFANIVDEILAERIVADADVPAARELLLQVQHQIPHNRRADRGWLRDFVVSQSAHSAAPVEKEVSPSDASQFSGNPYDQLQSSSQAESVSEEEKQLSLEEYLSNTSGPQTN